MADIQFTAVVYKVQTLVDGGVRVTLDLPETAIMQMAQLAECQRFGVMLEIDCRPVDDGKTDETGRIRAKGNRASQEWKLS